ncbi:hypothetical protein D3C73_404280 [compost metagenome]
MVLPDWDMSEEGLTGFLEFVTSSYDNFNEDDVRILLAMQHREDARLIGWCGVFPNDLLLESDREIAYAISKDYRNKGYTTEAVKGMVDYVFGRSSLQEIVAIVKPFNVSSKRVIEKAGFTHRRLTTLTDQCEYDYFSVEKA